MTQKLKHLYKPRTELTLKENIKRDVVVTNILYGALAILGIPLCFFLLRLTLNVLPIEFSPEIFSIDFDEDGNLKVDVYFQLFSGLIGLFYGTVGSRKKGALAIYIVSLIYVFMALSPL